MRGFGKLAAPTLAIALGSGGFLAGCKDSPTIPPPPTLGSQAPTSAATAATLTRPIAAALSPDGKTLFVTAFDMNGQGQILSGAVGGSLSPLTAGVTLSYPCGIVVTSDGSTLLVVDLGDAGAAGPTGALYRGTPSGGLTALSQGTPQYPTAVALSLDDQTVYVSGSDPTDGQPGVWSIAVGGGTPVQVYKGAPLSYPAGLAVANDGSLYVADNAAVGGGQGAIYRLQANRALQINKTPLHLLFPVGLSRAGTGYPDLLFTSALATGTEPYLYKLSPDGTQTALPLSGGVTVTEATTVSRAAKADLWGLVNGVSPAPDLAGSPGVPDPAKLDNPDGQVITLSP